MCESVTETDTGSLTYDVKLPVSLSLKQFCILVSIILLSTKSIPYCLELHIRISEITAVYSAEWMPMYYHLKSYRMLIYALMYVLKQERMQVQIWLLDNRYW